MEVRRSRVTSTVRTEGGLLPADLLAKISAADPTVPGLTPPDLGLAAGERVREAITGSWNRLVGAWAALDAVRVGSEPTDPLTGPTRERFLIPLFEELGFGRLPVARAVEIDGTAYPISHAWSNDAGSVRVPVHLVGVGVTLDARSRGVRGAAGAAPHALVQEFLNRSDDALWGLVTNGRTLRLLRDSTSLTRQAFIEFDLQQIFEGALYADFALLWTVCHRTRFEGERAADCLLERWTKKAADDGTRALDKLRKGVEDAITALGSGFLAHPANGALRDALRSGDLDRQDYYRELLRLVYRLIFLFTAEDRRDEETGRELLLDPAASDEAVARFRESYSTARLRDLAIRRRGTRHSDQWVVLRRVVAALGGAGAPTIALPALGSFLFGPQACRHLDAAELRNEDLLVAVRALSSIEEDRRLRAVDYQNLGAEELGSVYEGLLELHPRIEMDANPPGFDLATAAGNERRSTGSYYTPTSLIGCLLDSALDPVVDEAVAGKEREDAEAALLSLTVVDPAAGSGHFLVAAAHRLAKRLAAIRTGEGEPPPRAVRHALRDVIARCIHAVDINPMAVELCKVSLWLEALEPGRPLTFLDAHIKSGNSLLGTTPELAAQGIPDGAYEPIIGDDKEIVRAWRRRNVEERAGQQTLFEAPLSLPTGAIAKLALDVDRASDDTAEALAEKASRYAAFEESFDLHRSRAALDAWCGAFVVPRRRGDPEITTSVVRAAGLDPTILPEAAAETVQRAAREFAFFHWPLEFPAVFERGGFDVVIGNPPWERIKLQEQEFFAERSPSISGARNAAARKRMIAALDDTDPALLADFRAALRRSEGEGQFLRSSGRYPLTGRGDVNTYAVFAELMRTLVRRGGRMGVIVPTGIATDDTTKLFFLDLVTTRSLVSLYSFENAAGIFPAVHRQYNFCVLAVGFPGMGPAEAEYTFFATSVAELAVPGRRYRLAPADLALINPNTRTSPMFRNHAEAELAKSIYRRVPVLVDDASGAAGNPWGLSFFAMFHMANDSGLFFDGAADDRLPLYEAKMVHQFDHRYGSYQGQTEAQASQGVVPHVTDDEKADPSFEPVPKYWVERRTVLERLGIRAERGWLMGWRDIARAGDARTLTAVTLPLVGVGHKLPLMFPSHPYGALLGAVLDGFVVDWVCRQKFGTASLAIHVLKQLPVLTPAQLDLRPSWSDTTLSDWLRPYVVELTYTSHSVAAAARELGWAGPPFRWDSARRRILRAEVDAALFHAYGLSRIEAQQVMDSFSAIKRREQQLVGEFRTGRLVLDAYDRMSEAGPSTPFRSALLPAPGDPALVHASESLRSGVSSHTWASTGPDRDG